MILYHGSNVEVKEVDLSKCRPFKDFGKGFYLTTLEKQAFAMARRTTVIAERGTPVVSVWQLADDWREKGLTVRSFNAPTPEWAKFVMNNRDRAFKDVESPECNRCCQYDIVTGPVANDRIAASFQLFLDEFITIDELVERLKYRELNDQYSFHTEQALQLLTLQGFLYER